MKKQLCLILAVLCFIGAFTGCANEKKDKADTPDTPARVFDTPQQEALVVVAEAYYNHAVYFQYDATDMMTSSGGVPKIRRWTWNEDTPETGTSQYTCYTCCAPWIHDVYLEAFDYDIVNYAVANFRDDMEMRIFYHDVTRAETDEEKAAFEKEFRENLQVGDVIFCSHITSSGHALLYVGDGQILHSAVPQSTGGNYDYVNKVEKREPKGSISYTTVDNLFTPGDSYYLWEEKNFGIARPLKKHPDLKVSEKTQNRIDNLQNITVEMITSHPASITADLGEEVTFTFSLRNGRSTAATVDIEDVLPEGCTYVSGADKIEGNKVTMKVTIPSGETVKASYVVKVNNDTSLYGKYLLSENAKVGGISVPARPVYIGKHLNESEQKAISNAAAGVIAGSLKGTDLAEKIYKDAGIEISLGSAKSILESLYKAHQNTTKRKVLNESSLYANMVAPTMYGGTIVANTDKFYSRTCGTKGAEIMAGDIVLCMEDGKYSSWMYVGGNKVFDLESGKMLEASASRDLLMAVIAYDTFAIIRPAME